MLSLIPYLLILLLGPAHAERLGIEVRGERAIVRSIAPVVRRVVATAPGGIADDRARSRTIADRCPEAPERRAARVFLPAAPSRAGPR